MSHALAVAPVPFAGILLLSRVDVIIVDVLDQRIHVVEVGFGAAIPLAERHLFLEVILVEPGADRRAGNISFGVFRDVGHAIQRVIFGVCVSIGICFRLVDGGGGCGRVLANLLSLGRAEAEALGGLMVGDVACLTIDGR
jgi:hypothetical protein